jgi:GGDEF domain-containing protein
MSKRNRRYQLPRNWIVLPIIIYTVLIIVTFIAISMSTMIFAEYTTNLKAKAETEAAFSYAELYENASEDQLENLYSEISSKYEFFIADKDWNVLYPSGSQMTLVIPEEENELEPLNASFVTNIPGFDKMPLDPDSLRIIVADNARYCADKDTSFFNIEDNSISPNSFEILNDQDLLTSIFNNGSVPVPYWTVFEVKEGKELIAFKTHIDIHLTDVIYIGCFALLSTVISGIIFILLLINVIRTHINNRKMRNIVFRDHVTGNRNWFWFALKSKEILRKRRNNVQYAIVSLAFVRYRNYVLCHSVEAGEKKLQDIWKTISSSLEKNEICAHSSLANFPILIKAATAADANARVDRIIKSLSVLSGDHDFKFQAGVCMIDPKIRKDADIDLLYNNASSARATLETTDDTGIAFFDNKLVEDEKWIDLVTERQRDALEKEEFKVYYQPKFDPRTNELRGCEALIRWVSDDMGFVTPGQFIPIFEKSGFITEIDHYMLSHVARDQKSWLDEGRKCVPVSVNVSRAHFAETNLA